MFFLSPSERKVLIFLAFLVFLGTLIRYFNLEVENVVVSSEPAASKPLVIEINTALAGDLEKLPGIGPVIAQRIIECRRRKGPFQNISDLQRVNGIGEHKAKIIEKHLKF